MKSLSTLLRSAALALIITAAPQPARAQAIVQALPGTTDADRLADQMRRIGNNPLDVAALVEAGELSVRLGDMSGAASLFARAEKVDPRNARVKAGVASILVRSERPAEALRYFQQAESFGLSPRVFASDRGLAYDLVGEQDRAQRDYRTALAALPGDEETVTRYALSLGITGRKDQALAQLAPLLQKSDRGAWRARAFVLAMGGDVPGAAKIATTMMPPGMAQGLMPFFQRLPTLPAIDRAFAVHFGEVRPTPERLADARLKPALPALDPEPAVMLANAPPAPVVEPAKKDKRTKRDRRSSRNKAPAVAPPPVQVAQVDMTPPPPAYQAPIEATYDPLPPTVRGGVRRSESSAAMANAQALAAMKSGSPLPVPVQSSGALPTRTVQQLAAIPMGMGATRTSSGGVAGGQSALPTTALPPARLSSAPQSTSGWQSVDSVGTGRPAPVASAPASTAPAAAAPIKTAPVRTTPVRTAPVTTAPVTTAPLPTPQAVAATVPTVAEPTPVRVAETAPTPMRSVPVPAPTAGVAAPPPSVVPKPAPAAVRSAQVKPPAPTTPPTRRMSEDSILAKIVAGLSIPASELGVEGPQRSVVAAVQPVSTAATDALADAQAKRDADAAVAAQKLAAEKLAAEKLAEDRLVAATKAAADKKLAAEKLAADRKAAAKKTADAKQAIAEKKMAAEKKELADKKAAEAKAAKADPERIWVQVSGGAYAGDLPKAWSATKAKAPEAFAGKQGWSTPLRATNRVLAGPFKTDDEARSFVNALAKKGISAFPFTSEKGQKVVRLGAK